MRRTMAGVMVFLMAGVALWGQAQVEKGGDGLMTGEFRWTTGQPILAPAGAHEDWIALKDPTIVRHKDRWHLFCSLRGRTRSHAVVYVSFEKWADAPKAKQTILPCHDGFFGAPQVFYFAPQKKWYLICQGSHESWTPKYQAAYSTSAHISDPDSWSALKPLGARPANGKIGLDFWIICDDRNAYLFFTTLNGRMWREQTPLADFPTGWSKPALAIRGDVFEASHTYKLKGQDGYLTLIEAQGGHGWRYFKAYIADRLDGEWKPLAATKDKAFASMKNVRQAPKRWTDVISHGELIRSGRDQRLEVDPADLRFLFQGVTSRQRRGKKYGEIPWRLGILEPEE